MKPVTMTQDVLEGRDRYTEGKTYELPDDLALYFVRNGWATGEGEAEEQPEEVTLKIQDGRHGIASKVKG